MTPAQFITAINANFVDIKYVPSTITTIDADSDVTVINANFQDIKGDTVLPPTTGLIVAGLSGADYASKLNSNFNNYDEILEKRYSALGFGMFLGFSIGTFNNVTPPTSIGDLDPDIFNPTDLDIDEWLDTAVTAGMKYVSIVTKGEDGFALYPTNYAVPGHDPYSIAQSSWYAANGNLDILDYFVTGCRARGLKIVFYYGIYDLTHEIRSETDEASDPTAYINKIDLQLTELLTNYGAIDAVWFDNWQYYIHYADIPFEGRYNLVKTLQPSCLVFTNEHVHPNANGDIDIYEAGDAPTGLLTERAEWAKTMRLDGVWMYDATKDQTASAIMTKTQILEDIAFTQSIGCNYLLNAVVNKTGHLIPAEKTMLESLQT